jgi:Sulfotransferase domain.
MYNLWKQIYRRLALAAAFHLPEADRIALERRLRGKEEARKLSLCDGVIVSYGKSGRTWLRVMLSRFYQRKFQLTTQQLLGFDNLHARNPDVPKIFFTHDNYLKDHTGHTTTKEDYYDQRVILLARDPRDIAVSQFFQWKFRMRPHKKKLNLYPPHGSDIPLFDFVMHETAGLPKIIDFLNLWASEMPRIERFLLVRYEDMRSDTATELRRITEFLGTPASDELIKDAVEFASIDNMRKLEQDKKFWLSGSRMLPKDKNNPNSYKVRRAKVGGWRDYFDDDQVEQIDTLVNSRLHPVYQYSQPRQVVNA